MRLQTLISTMNQIDYDLLEKMNINCDSIVVNQCQESSESVFLHESCQITWINSKDTGLSKSRNLALSKATADICLLADDDLEYIRNYKEIILKQFEMYPKADIIAFQVEGIERMFKRYSKHRKNINCINLMKISSVEIAFRRERINEKKVMFNELFGAGSKYQMGEESIFLSNCIRNGLNIMYVPIKIANLHIGESSWFRGFNKQYFINKGAAFAAMNPKLDLLFIIQFAIRKHKIYKENLSLINVMRLMINGRNMYIGDNIDD